MENNFERLLVKLGDFLYLLIKDFKDTFMKQLLLIFLSNFLIVAFLGAQSLILENTNGNVFGSPDDFEMSVRTNVKNVSLTAKNVLVRSQVISKPENTINFFCWQLCYGPSVLISPTALIIEPGQSVNNFHGYYRPENVAGIAYIAYTFYDEDNPSDSVRFVGQFNASAAGLSSVVAAASTVSVYPNPADEDVFLRYTLAKAPNNVSVEIYNMLGSKVLTFPVTSADGIITIPVDKMQAGLYFYSFQEYGKVIRSGRITVKH